VSRSTEEIFLEGQRRFLLFYFFAPCFFGRVDGRRGDNSTCSSPQVSFDFCSCEWLIVTFAADGGDYLEGRCVVIAVAAVHLF